jgi:hypothetical protein
MLWMPRSSAQKENPMNRILLAGASTILAASALGGMVAAGPASAATSRPTAQPASARTCHPTHHNYPFPSQPRTFAAAVAGSVTVAPVNSGTIKVTHVHRAPGYRSFIDSARGSSVDVYFSGNHRSIKFEAEINDAGGLTVTVTTCGR